MIGFFDVAIPIDREKLLAAGTIPKLEPAATLEDRAQELLSEFDNDGDGKLAKAELPKQFQGLFVLLDRNRDGFLDAAEVLVFVKASAGRRPATGGGERKKPGAADQNASGQVVLTLATRSGLPDLTAYVDLAAMGNSTAANGGRHFRRQLTVRCLDK